MDQLSNDAGLASQTWKWELGIPVYQYITQESQLFSMVQVFRPEVKLFYVRQFLQVLPNKVK